MSLFQTILIQPLLNLLIWFYNVIPGADMGLAIIALTVMVKALLWPFTQASLKSQKALQELQPKLNELKVQHKDDKEALAKAMMELYATEKVNPLSSCLPILVQIPILIALYRVLSDGLSGQRLDLLYPFVANPGQINANFFGFLDLTVASIPLAVIAGALQFVQARMLMPKNIPSQVKGSEGAKDEEMLKAMNNSMMYMMPVMTVVIGAKLPGGLTLYWVMVTLISVFQQWLVLRKKKQQAA